MHAYEAEVVVPRSRVLDLMNHPEHPSGQELWLRSTLDPMAFGFFSIHPEICDYFTLFALKN